MSIQKDVINKYMIYKKMLNITKYKNNIKKDFKKYFNFLI